MEENVKVVISLAEMKALAQEREHQWEGHSIVKVIPTLAERLLDSYDPTIQDVPPLFEMVDPNDVNNRRSLISATEIGAIKGASGSGKSTAVQAFLCAIYAEEIRKRGVHKVSDLTLGLHFNKPVEPFSVGIIDTEQSRQLFYNKMRGFYGRVFGDMSHRPNNLWVVQGKGVDGNYLLKWIEDLCIQCEKRGAPMRFFIADHIGDFLKMYNDESTAIQLFRDLDYLSTKYGFALIYLIHTNSTSTKQNGHTGSQGNRKNVVELLIQEDSESKRRVWMIPEKLRDAAKDWKVCFSRNKDGGYCLCQGGIIFENWEDGDESEISETNDIFRIETKKDPNDDFNRVGKLDDILAEMEADSSQNFDIFNP